MDTQSTKKGPLWLRLLSVKAWFKNPSERPGRVIFIISSGRTATNFLAAYFNSFHGVSAVHEPEGSRLLRLWSMAYLDEKVSETQMQKIIYSYRKNITSKDELYIESSPFLLGFLESIPTVFPDAELYSVVRDPRTYVTSAINHGNTKAPKRLLARFLPYWMPRLRNYFDDKKPSNLFELYCAYWAESSKQLCKKSGCFKVSHLYLFEELFDKKNTAIHQMAKHLELNETNRDTSITESKRLNESHYSTFVSWRDWDTKMVRQLDCLCNPYMKEFGYRDKEWLKRISKK